MDLGTHSEVPGATAHPAAPAVTVIIQTFNRSNILDYAIGSVLRQTFTDWELLVIGDGCTDDTAEVVASWSDPRIRFVNLPERVGDQSGPNNEGVRRARGRYVAYLNHDDIWLADHLERTTAALDSGDVDLVFTLQFEAEPDGRVRINACYPGGVFDPLLHPNNSAWVFRRELHQRVGPRQTRDRVYTFPTRDWIHRAWRLGAKLAAVPAATVVVISATTRRNVYAERQWREQAELSREIAADPAWRERKLTEAWVHPRPTHLRAFDSRVLVKALWMRWLGLVGRTLGIDPEAVYCYHRFPRKWGFLPRRGAVIRELYRRRGLAPWKRM
jgi:glycosyltransferase involved in cell wall biosynthesis